MKATSPYILCARTVQTADIRKLLVLENDVLKEIWVNNQHTCIQNKLASLTYASQNQGTNHMAMIILQIRNHNRWHFIKSKLDKENWVFRIIWEPEDFPFSFEKYRRLALFLWKKQKFFPPFVIIK
jgi:hypothetical protein